RWRNSAPRARADRATRRAAGPEPPSLSPPLRSRRLLRFAPLQLASDHREHGGCFSFHFAPGDAEDAVAGAEEFAVASAVALEGDLDGVVATAVGLDHEAALWPEE